jgi:hypothetical protein
VSQTGQVILLDAQTGSLVDGNSIYDGPATDPVTDGRLMFVASLTSRSTPSPPRRLDGVASPHRGPSCGCSPRRRPTGSTARCPGMGSRRSSRPVVTSSGRRRIPGPPSSGNQQGPPGRLGRCAGRADRSAHGDIIDKVALPGVAMMRPDKFDDGNLYVVSKSGVVARSLPPKKPGESPGLLIVACPTWSPSVAP